LRVADKLADRGYKVELLCLGDRPSSNLLWGNGFFRYCNTLKLNRIKVTYLGRLNATEIAKVMVDCTFYIEGSRIENSSNLLSEAMIVGLPSIVPSSIGGSIERVDFNSKCIYQSFDVRSCVSRVESFLSSKEDLVRLSNEQRNLARRRHNVDFILDEYFQILNCIIKNKNNR
jgi:glycosyltransferase involved in cell wall biosynthesis